MTDALLTIPALFAAGLLTGNEFATRAGVHPALDHGEWRSLGRAWNRLRSIRNLLNLAGFACLLAAAAAR